ncbi:hypothetical protein NOF55_15275 [Rhizobiaceae bacterium BDR2-2]|uniref:Uncharacterized protein n=1 Tax=Ectorhizobium quercum TaxID=2965071 RepID=A0AAE3N379_9HYPH|nr:hypothetical protein [Ectorhizobium quercum]MCX8998475.1 hypothetical protein [Ectorhizobium quercum]
MRENKELERFRDSEKSENAPEILKRKRPGRTGPFNGGTLRRPVAVMPGLAARAQLFDYAKNLSEHRHGVNDYFPVL